MKPQGDFKKENMAAEHVYPCLFMSNTQQTHLFLSWLSPQNTSYTSKCDCNGIIPHVYRHRFGSTQYGMNNVTSCDSDPCTSRQTKQLTGGRYRHCMTPSTIRQVGPLIRSLLAPYNASDAANFLSGTNLNQLSWQGVKCGTIRRAKWPGNSCRNMTAIWTEAPARTECWQGAQRTLVLFTRKDTHREQGEETGKSRLDRWKERQRKS